MTRKLIVALSLSALLAMGATGPSCPGQQALQQQVDQLQTKNQEQARAIQSLEGEVKTLQTDLAQLHLLTTQIGNTVLAQKQALEKFDQAIRVSRAAPIRAATPSRAATGKNSGSKRRVRR